MSLQWIWGNYSSETQAHNFEIPHRKMKAEGQVCRQKSILMSANGKDSFAIYNSTVYNINLKF